MLLEIELLPRYWFQPNWLSVLRGEFTDDFYASLRMLFFLVLRGGSTYLVYDKFFTPVEM